MDAEATRRQGEFLRDVMRLNAGARNFRVFSPDETASNRWNAVFEASDRCSTAEASPLDENVSPEGRVRLKSSKHVPWRRPIASLNYLLTSHVWRQDHNGFSHQDPGFIDLVANKKAGIIRVYLPPDANALLSVTDHCLRSRHYVNVIVAGKQLEPQWLDMDAAVKHCAAGIGIWEWASNDPGGEPDVVMAGAGDVPTLEKHGAGGPAPAPRRRRRRARAR